MNNSQTNYTAVAVAVVLGLCLLSAMININRTLEGSNQQVVKLQKQIDELKKTDADQFEQMHKMSVQIVKLNKELDDAETLQRLQAQAILSLKKRR